MESRDREASSAAGGEGAFADTVAPSGRRDPGAAVDDSSLAAGSSAPTSPPMPSGVTRTPATAARAAWAGDTLDAPLGESLDVMAMPLVDRAHYVADRELARGGMGRIVAGRDRRLGRPVAIKELLAVGPDQALRFRREALITARLQHPAIVPVYEAGRWSTGEPFYAMKLVAGRPLDRVVADAKTMVARLALLPSLITVADAIAYAHSQRVIHRDLKPANVLVGDFGETVVIDWGLAKDLSEEAAPEEAITTMGEVREPATASAPAFDVAPSAIHTAMGGPRTRITARPSSGGDVTVAGAVMGTPAYMAPEQARGEPVDERADVFALGAMLYHLLAGAPPYHARTAIAVITAAAAGEVVALRERAPRTPPELVAIVERAMALDAADRYPSARELADELRRFQTGKLVAAHHYTPWQKLKRFLRRHRAPATIAALALAGFVVGGTLAVRRIVAERDRADALRQLAESRKAAAEHLVDYMVSDMRDRLRPIGRVDLMAGLGRKVRGYYDEIGGGPGGLGADDVRRMSLALETLGEAEQSRGDLDAALATWDDAKRRLAAAVAADPDGPQAAALERRIAVTGLAVGGALQARGRIDDATLAYREALAVFDRLLAADADDADTLLGAADGHDRLGDLLRNPGDVERAMREYQIARGQRERVVDRYRDDRRARYDLSTSHLKIAAVHEERGDTSQALAEYRACAQLRGALVDADPDNTGWQQGLAYVETSIGDLQRELGDIPAAIASYEATLPTMDRLVRRDPSNTSWRRDRGNLLSNLGFALLDQGDARRALERHRAAIANHEELLVRDPDNTSWQIDLSRMHTRAGDALLHTGDVAAALASYETARAMRAALVARDPHNGVWQRSLAWSHQKIGGALAVRGGDGDVDRAIAEHREALRIRDELVRATPQHAGLRNELAGSEILVGRLLVRAGAGDDALGLLGRGIGRARDLVAGDPVNLEWKETLVMGLVARGDARRRAGDVTLARADLEQALAIAEAAAALAPSSALWQATQAEARWDLARCLRGPGEADRAARLAAAARDALDRLAADGRLGSDRRALYQDVRRGR